MEKDKEIAKHWKRLSTRKIFRNKYASLEEDIVVTPKGKKISYICAGRGAASLRVIPVSKEGKITFVYQFRYPHQKCFWELPGGSVDKNENPESAALRELKEEVSLETDKLIKLGEFAPSPGIQWHIKHLFLAENTKPAQDVEDKDYDDSEFIQKVENFTLDEVTKMIKNREIQEADTVLAIFLYRDYLNQEKK